MTAGEPAPCGIDDYIAAQPPEVRPILQKIRQTVQRVAPGATETISYRLPSFVLKRHLVYFGAFKTHIGFYPPVRDASLQREAAAYAGEKGNLRFPLDQAIPYALIGKIVKARLKENAQAELAQKARRRAR